MSAVLLSATAAFAQTTAAPATEPETLHLSAFQVNTSRDKGYGATNSLGASRVNVPLENIPGSVIVVNRQLIEDTAAREFIDVLRFVSGVSNAGGPLNGQFVIRGSTNGGTMLRDGLPEGASLAGYFFDLAPYERIEVIKGPSGALYGSHSVGGIINRIAKQPLSENRYSLQTSVTSANGHQIYRAEADATGPIDQAKKWQYRVIGAWSEGETWFDRDYDREVFSPIITFAPTRDLRLWARYEYQFSNLPNVEGSWIANARGQISTFLNPENVTGDEWSYFNFWKHFAETGAEMRFFNGKLTSRLTGRYSQENRQHNRYILSAAGSIRFYNPAGVLIGDERSQLIDFNNPAAFGSIRHSRQYAPETQNQITRNLYWDNVGNFDLGPTKHQLLAYAAYNELSGDNRRHVSPLASTPTFDYLNPVYDPVFNRLGLPLTRSVDTGTRGESYNYGVQDNISLFDERLILVGGFRYDNTESNNQNRLNNTATRNAGEDTSYKWGVVGKPVKGVSLFYNYSETFIPRFGTYNRYPDLVVLPLANQRGAMDEVGLKLDLYDARLVATASWFDITLDNNTASGPTLNGVPTTIFLADQTIKGWEADIAFQPTPALTALVGIGDMESRGSTGLLTNGVPQGLSYKGLAKYTFLKGALSQLSLGTSYEYVNERAGDPSNTFMLPDYDLWSIFATYRTSKHWSLQVNVDNLLDKVYATSASNPTSVYVGDPRTVRVIIGYRF
jgi:iron complex outermembrane receptor protein